MCLYWTATVHLQQQINSPSTYYLHLICTVQKTFEDDLGLCRAAAHSDARSLYLAAVVTSNLSYHWPFTSALLTFDDFFVFLLLGLVWGTCKCFTPLCPVRHCIVYTLFFLCCSEQIND